MQRRGAEEAAAVLPVPPAGHQWRGRPRWHHHHHHHQHHQQQQQHVYSVSSRTNPMFVEGTGPPPEDEEEEEAVAPGSSGYGSHNGGGSSCHRHLREPLYAALLEPLCAAGFVKSVSAAGGGGRSRRSVGSLGSGTQLLGTIPEGGAELAVPRPVWPAGGGDALLLCASLTRPAEDDDPGRRHLPENGLGKPSLLAGPDAKPSVWEIYYGAGVATDPPHPQRPAGRPEADFTLDVPRSELLTRKMAAAKKWRFRCRLVTTLLGLLFFLLSLMAVSLVLTRGRRMFGSML